MSNTAGRSLLLLTAAAALVSCAGCKGGLFANHNAVPSTAEEQELADQQQVQRDRYGNPIHDNLTDDYNGVGEQLTDGDKKPWQEGFPTPKKMWAAAKDMVGMGPDKAIANAAYAKGEQLFRDKNYDDAAKEFKTAYKRWPDSALEEDAMFMLGESYFFADRYDKASDTFVNLMKKYENSRHLDKVTTRQFAIAHYWVDIQRTNPYPFLMPNFFEETRPWFDTAGNGLAVYESVWINDPTGPLSDDAVIATANEHFVNDRFEDADSYYTQLRRDYPKSEHQWPAHLLGLRSKLGKYQGPRYDDTPLQEAQDLVEQTLARYPEMENDERERLLKTRTTIVAQKAERNWNMGEYYAKRDYNRAAKYYWALVVEEAPETRFAEMARERLDARKAEPDLPENHFQWLVDAFPEPRQRGLPDGSDSGTARLARNPKKSVH